MAEVRLKLDYVPRDWQLECHKKLRRFNVLALHRRAGKTTMAIMQLVHKAIQCNKPLPMFAYVAPWLKQAKGTVWKLLKAKLEPIRVQGGVTVREGDLMVTFVHNGASIRLFGADNPDSMRGYRLDGVVCDEVAQFEPSVWYDVLQPALSDRLGWAMFIGTPNGVDLFSELYYKAESSPDWFSARFSVYDTGALEAAEVERLRDPRNMPEASFAREYLCDFTASGEDQLISMSDAEDAARRTYPVEDYERSAKIIGCDPARFGDDRSVIIRRQGLQAFPPIVLRGVDNMALADRIVAEMIDWRPDAVFVDAGAGAGVIDRLRQLRRSPSPIEVPFGGRALKDELYVNRRTEMWFLMKEWIQSGGAIPNEQSLKAELSTPTYTYNSLGKRVLESKEQIKKRLMEGGSPDIADALALTFALPVATPDLEQLLRSTGAIFGEPSDHHDEFGFGGA